MRTKSIVIAVVTALFLGLLIPSSALAAGSQSGDLDQWANNAPGSWVNGNLNPSKSHYREDYVVPYRARLTGLIIGDSYSLPIEWDTTKGGLHAQDFLQTYNFTETDADPCVGGACPAGAPTTFPIPIDLNVNSATNPPILSYSAGDPRFLFTMWGGTITGASTPVVSSGSFSGGTYSSDSSTSTVVTFTATSTSAVLAWGGHISTHSDWGVGQTAVNIAGSSYHMRLGSALNGNFYDETAGTNSTMGNQDRSMKLATNAFSSRVTIIKAGDADANALFSFGLTQPQNGACNPSFGLHVGDSEVCNLLDVDGSFTVTENLGASDYAWGLTNIQCTSIGEPVISDFNVSSLPVNAPGSGTVSFSLNTAYQQDATCTFTNNFKPRLTLQKIVHNNYGGTDQPGDFNFYVTGSHVLDLNGNPLTSADILHDGQTVIMDANTAFSVTEDPEHYGYVQESETGCSGTGNFDDQNVCTITNQDVQPQMTVIKHVINNNGGSAVAGDFTMFVSGTNVSSTSFAGDENGQTITLNQGSYSVTESGPAGYIGSDVGCTGDIKVGDNITCTFTNDDIGPQVRVFKNAIGGNENFPILLSSSNGVINSNILTTGGSGGDPYAQPPVAPTPGTGDTGYLEVAAGNVTVAEDLSGLQTDPAWHFTSVSCQEDTNPPTPISVAQNAAVTLNGLQLNHFYSCTFTNTRDASIPLTKNVNGNAPTCDPDTNVCTDSVSGQTIPSFTIAQFPQGTYPPSDPLASITGPPFQALSGSGSFTLCETGLPAGWNLSTGDVSVDITMFGGATGSFTPTVSEHDTADPASVNRCFDITIPAGAETVAITIDNQAEGALQIVKQAVGGDDTFTFSINGGPTAFNDPIAINTANSNTSGDLAAQIGDYTVTETNLPAGWALKDITCTSTVSSNPEAAQITATVVPGETTVCTYTDTKYGHLIVHKVTDPASDTTTEFSITATGSNTITAPAARTLTGGSSTDYEVLAGTFSVTESVPAGWDQTGNTCTDVAVAAGATVDCTITNTKRGHLIVQKTTFPSGDPTVFDITASGTGTVTSGPAGTVTDATDHDYEVIPGTYSVAETVPAGWDMNTNTCTAVVVAPGATETCEITNTKRGHIIVQKTTFPSGDPTVFDITASGTGTVTSGAAGTVTDATDHDYEVIPGTYSVAETVPAGWDMNTNTCADVVVAPGATETCEITNTKRGHIIVQKTTFPSGDPTVFDITASGTGTVTSGAAGTVTDATDHDYEVIPGTYSVAETVPAGWDMNTNTCADVVVAPGATETCEITNTKRGHIIVQKTTNPSGDPTVFDITASGTGTVTSGAAGTVTDATDHDYEVIPGTYSVTETVPAGWDMNTNTCTDVVVAPGATETCEITNTKRGHIIVQKTTNPSGDPTVFDITASGTGTVTSGAAGTVTDATDHDYEVIPGTYSVTETVPAGWDMNTNTCADIVVAPGAIETCEITNTKRGHLIVQKTTDPSGDPTVFDITASGTGTVTSGPAGTVTDATDHDYEVIPGTYSVTESVPAGWDMNTNTCVNVVVAPGAIETCEITNTKRGHLIVQKTTDPSGDPTSFSITASGSGTVTSGAAGFVTDATDHDYEVIPGIYSVAETVPAGWDMTVNLCVNVQVGAGQTVTCEITNVERGHLIVHKATDPANDPTSFAINASGSGSITGGGAGFISTLAPQEFEVTPGSYSVAETVPAGWDMTGNTCQGVIVNAGQTVDCTISNTMKGHLIVTKVTEPSTDTSTQFPVIASGSGAITAPADRILVGNGGSTDYEVAGNETYSVAENVPDGWSQQGNTCQNLTVLPGQTVNCEIRNTQFGHIVVTKIVINDNGGTETPSSFTMNVAGNGANPASFPGGSGTTVDVIAGAYSVSESGPSGYAASYSADCSGTVAAGETKTCTVTNDDIQPKLIVTKVVVNDNGGTALPSDFTMNVAGDAATPSSFAGGSGTLVALNAGAFSVTESGQSGYAASFSADCSGTINVGEEKTCTVTNDDIQPVLIVVKQVINNNGRTKTPSDFTMSVMSNNLNVASFPGGAGTPVGIDAGTYAVTETGVAGYQGSFSAECSGTIAVGETRTCVVTNNDIPYGIITNSELCQFNVGAPDQFLLNFKNDKGNSYTLNASNPGQFYYNIVNGDQAGTITMTIPYPFVTSGATPIHVYTADNFQWDDASQCFNPGTAAAGYSTPQITLSSTYPYTVTLTNVPAGAYVNIHLDYGLKGTTQWTKTGQDAHKGNEAILDGQTYTFSDGTNQQTTSSTNRFN